MPARRVFLDWQRPALISAVDYLRNRYAASTTWDLANVILVVPGRRAGRRLLELLVFAAKASQLELTPPTITTEGKLPELLYRPKFPFADNLTQELAWSAALQQIPREQLTALVPHPPAADNTRAWRELGKIMRTRHAELTADTLEFSHVVSAGARLPNFPDAARWQAMSAAQTIYLHTLDQLQLWDIQTARLRAIEWNEIHTPQEIVLLGTVDLNLTMRKMLDKVSEQVTALVAAPESLANMFDEHGCVLSQAWKAYRLPLHREQIQRVDGPADQADAVARALASYAGKYRGDEITIGLPDEQIVPHLQRQLEQCGVPVRWVQGKLLTQTGPYLLLAAIAEFLEEESAVAFAALIRHPDLFAWLTRVELQPAVGHRVLNELDTLVAEFLVTRMAFSSWPKKAQEAAEKPELDRDSLTHLARALVHVRQLLAALQVKAQPFSRWSQPILETLHKLYGSMPQLISKSALDALDKIRGACQLQSALPASLEPKLSAAEAIHWTLEQLRGEAIPPPADEEAVELLGWLELPLDDAPALIITSFNEGFVPESTTADAFLPNTLRTHLGLLDNDRRYARDAYNLAAILHSRATVQVISARRDAADNPLVPSRLLFATEPAEVVERSLQFFKPLKETPQRLPLIGWGMPVPTRSRLEVPLPQEVTEPFEKIRVTQFRDYLACPYRFYLKHVLALRMAGDLPEELEGNAFGTLVHDVLQSFGKLESIRDSKQSDEIYDFLSSQLEHRVNLRYGEQRLAAMEIQLAHLKKRLQKFSDWQAARTREGWRIVLTEDTDDASAANVNVLPFEPEAQFMVDDKPITLRGRIDRIDRHEATGELVIYDYKTSDSGEKPKKAHYKQGKWVDLQLPLYRHLAKAWGHSSRVVRLGYILLPKALDEVGDSLADWSDEELQEADETAREVIRNIREGIYWPPQAPPQYEDDFTAICQDRRLGGRNLPALHDPEEAP
jgi:RecB family exonuclease